MRLVREKLFKYKELKIAQDFCASASGIIVSNVTEVLF